MKAKYLTTIALAAAMLSSCDMNVPPEGVLSDENAIQSLNDVFLYRNSFYTGLRGIGTSAYFSYPEIQADMFNGIVINGNQIGSIANGDIVPSNDDLTGLWASLYGAVNSVNYFLEHVEPVYNDAVENNKQADIAKMDLYIGEAHFVRGYYYALLLDRWCVQPTAEVMDKPGTGLPIVTVFEPTADRSKYKGRSTMRETIDFINDEIKTGLDAITKYENDNDIVISPMSRYLNSNAVKAMQARIALWCSDYQTAYNKATEIIESGIYQLCERKDLKTMWRDDSSSEIIFEPFMSTQELSGSIGGAWLATDPQIAYYIPAADFIKMMGEGYNPLIGNPDGRYDVYFADRDLVNEGETVTTPCFNKFPGNPELMTGSTNNLRNMPKLFRLSELYLIAAESAAAMTQEDNANKYLKELRSKRYLTKTIWNKDYSGAELTEIIRTERGKELAGEGFRISDLRRWKVGFNRTNGSDYGDTSVEGLLTPAGLNVVYTPDDHRYTWPIPSDEMQSNPQLAGQQNPGY